MEGSDIDDRGVYVDDDDLNQEDFLKRFYNGKEPKKLSTTIITEISKVTEAANSIIRGNWDDDFVETDHLFIMFIKAMVAKIFAVLGLYTIFNRPNLSEISKINLSMSSVRTVLGGAQRPKIIPDAVELYIRLPLLAEWYRDRIGLNRKDNGSYENAGTGMMIAFIPDITGDWADFINIIFNKTDLVKEGSYSGIDIDNLINEINRLYMLFRKQNPKDTVHAACASLVQEINRRYGLLRKEEVKLYMENRWTKDRYEGISYDETFNDNVDFDILDAKESYGKRPAPSDKYLRYRPIDISKTQTWNNEVRKAVFEFRKALDDGFEKYIEIYNDLNMDNNPHGVNLGSIVSFDETVRQYRAELHSTADEHEKYNIVTRSIRGVGRFSSIGADKVILFHELVVSPLVSLANIYKVLKKFEDGITILHAQYEDGATDNKLHLFVEYIYSICSFTELISLQITTGKTRTLIIDFSGMKEFAETSLNNIKLAINKFRLQIDKQYIAKFESSYLKYQNKDIANELSVYWLEDNLIDRMLKGRRESFSDITGIKNIQDQITDIMKKIGEDGEDEANDKRYGELFDRLCYWDSYTLTVSRSFRNDTEFPFNILPHAELLDSSRTKALDQLEGKLSGGNRKTADNFMAAGDEEGKAYISLKALGGFYIRGISNTYNRSYTDNKLTKKKGHGLLLQFNQILAKYIQQFFDAPTRKIYSGLLEDFVNGQYSNSIMRGEAIDDFTNTSRGLNLENSLDPYAAPAPDHYLSDPKSGIIIFASIARAIKVLALRNTPEGKPLYFVDSISEVRSHIIDNMVTNLLGFRKLFMVVKDRAAFLKLLLIETSIGQQVGRPNRHRLISTIDYPGLFKMFETMLDDKDSRKIYLADLLDHIRAACNSIIGCIDKTYKELNDVPYFMETYKGFFENYRSKNGHYPLTLLSNIQSLMTNPLDESTALKTYSPSHSPFLPLHQGSTAVAKFNRGMRGVLHGQNMSIDHFPGFLELVDSYNALLQQKGRFDRSFIKDSISRELLAVRFVADIKHYKSQMIVLWEGNSPAPPEILPTYYDIEYESSDEVFKRFDLEIDLRAIRNDDAHKKIANRYFQPFARSITGASGNRNFSRLIFTIENDAYKQNKVALLMYYTKGYRGMRQVDASTQERENARFLNLVDLDIVPINVHALGREVPLINIMNYSFSFDQMIKELFKLKGVYPGKQSLIAPTLKNLIGPVVNNNYPSSIKKYANNIRSENTLVTTLANPYMTLLGFHYFHQDLLGRIMSGGMGIEGFDRPKYLSDQIWNKVALQEIHPIGHWENPDASGPFVAWHRQLPIHETGDGVVPSNEKHWNEVEDDRSLSYYKNNDTLWAGRGAKTELVRVPVKSKDKLQLLGVQRYDTKLVRNIVWLTQLQRIVRWYLRQALHNRSHPLVYNVDVSNEDNTEYYNNQTYDINEFEGPVYSH